MEWQRLSGKDGAVESRATETAEMAVVDAAKAVETAEQSRQREHGVLSNRGRAMAEKLWWRSHGGGTKETELRNDGSRVEE